MIGSSMMSKGNWKLIKTKNSPTKHGRTWKKFALSESYNKQSKNEWKWWKYLLKYLKYTLSNSSKASLNSALRSSSRLVPILFFFTKINICMIWKLKSLTYSVLHTFHFSLSPEEFWVLRVSVHRTRDNWGLGWGDTKESHIHSKYGNAGEKYKEKSISIVKLCLILNAREIKVPDYIHIKLKILDQYEY